MTTFTDSFSTCKGETAKVVAEVAASLTGQQLVVHEVERETRSTEILGWSFEDGHIVRPTRARIWKCRLAIRSLLAIGHASGRELERIVGHLTFACLLRRESLAVFGAVYRLLERATGRL